jgi:branched-subunit amino acid transport protein AzlD
MLNLCGIVAAILKMETGRNFSMSGINSGGWCPELIPDIEKFLPITIFKMASTIPHKFNIIRFQRPELIPDIEKFLPISIFKIFLFSGFREEDLNVKS